MKFVLIFAAIVAVASAAPVETVWSLQQVDAALQNPDTNPALIPYLIDALNYIMAALYSGNQIESVAIVLPPEIAVDPEEIPTPIGVAVEPAQVAPVQASARPVHIIVNKQGEATAPSPDLVPEPTLVPEIVPTPVIVVDEAAKEIDLIPEVVFSKPEGAFNPIDVIAVAAIDYNPVDHLNPIPANQGGAEILV